MIMFRNEVLICRSSLYIQFHKLQFDKSKGKPMWKLYHSIESQGFICGNKGSNNFTIIEDQLIYFYELNEDTLMPQVINVMVNFMQCDVIIIGEA